jgi:hypothetical protein
MVMAGLWAKWKDSKSGDQIESCTILTCGPNKVIGELHNRMPVVLSEPDWPRWLGEEPAAEEELLAMLKPCPDRVTENLAGEQDGRQWQNALAAVKFKRFAHCGDGLVTVKTCECHASNSRVWHYCHAGYYCHTFDGSCRK